MEDGTSVAYKLFCEHVPFLTEDVFMLPIMGKVRQLVANEDIRNGQFLMRKT